MGVDLAQGAVVAQLDQLLGRQGFQLVFRDGVVFGDLLRRGGGAVGIARGEDGFARVQQVELVEKFDEGVGALALLLEIIAEFHGLFDVGRGLAVDEQLRGPAVPDKRRVAVHAQDQPLLRLVIGEDERITAHIGRDIGFGAELAGFIDEQVLAAAQGHDGHRLALVADEDHRIRKGRRRELGHRQRHQIGLGHKAVGLVDGIDAERAVRLDRQGLGLAIEQDVTGQGGAGRGVGHGRVRALVEGKGRLLDQTGQGGKPARVRGVRTGRSRRPGDCGRVAARCPSGSWRVRAPPRR